MPSPTSSITSLTADYEAIERAIRETSRGRWFLSCYLERNRSAETKMLLNAIAKLESAMRDSGHIMGEKFKLESLAALREAVDQARDDMAHMPLAAGETARLPLKRFDFDSVPAAIADETQTIRECAASIHSAAYALHAAGVFQGVAKELINKAADIERACLAQETALSRVGRMARLVSEIESELIALFDDDQDDFYDAGSRQAEVRDFLSARQRGREIPDELIEQISAALGEGSTGVDHLGRPKS